MIDLIKIKKEFQSPVKYRREISYETYTKICKHTWKAEFVHAICSPDYYRILDGPDGSCFQYCIDARTIEIVEKNIEPFERLKPRQVLKHRVGSK